PACACSFSISRWLRGINVCDRLMARRSPAVVVIHNHRAALTRNPLNMEGLVPPEAVTHTLMAYRHAANTTNAPPVINNAPTLKYQKAHTSNTVPTSSNR